MELGKSNAVWAQGRLTYLLTLLILSAGCGSKPLDVNVPGEFQLQGEWLLNTDLSDPALSRQQLKGRIQPTPIGRRGGNQRTRANREFGGLAFITHDFPVLIAKRMHIEQNSDSMGIQYDGGNYRDISWGERTRGLWQVRTGWLEGSLVVDSKANDAKAMERFTLTENGDRLEIWVQIDAERDDIAVNRVFDRVR